QRRDRGATILLFFRPPPSVLRPSADVLRPSADVLAFFRPARIIDRRRSDFAAGHGMISFFCPHCGAQLRVRPAWAGAKGKCPRCGKPIEAPEDTPSGADRVTERTPKPGSSPRPTFETAGRDDDLSFLAPAEEVGELGRLSHYRVLKVLGQGGMG